MHSIEIFRSYRKFSILKLTKEAGIDRKTYYNILSGLSYITPNIILKLDNALSLNGLLQFTYLFDRLYQLGIKLSKNDIIFPRKFPSELLILFYTQHPIFNHNCRKFIHNLNENQG